MVFLNNFVHADLHPGNLLVTQVKRALTHMRSFMLTNQLIVFFVALNR